ncbi:unnamed protein product [Darwinula stevensoni]|uniref:GTPase Era, mitochondrial n=1 Tax=Darwinula stevensoni TaxID=69355 RepID=A0A7R8XBE7_9CRUS|nr:unnamed protein product [Darwinula stevensoni]CAG0892749.1 unnamed protein product [Darwinula stevensoni]
MIHALAETMNPSKTVATFLRTLTRHHLQSPHHLQSSRHLGRASARRERRLQGPTSPLHPSETERLQVPRFRDAAATSEELRRRLGEEPRAPPDARSVGVVVLGAPNAGKSTLVNQLMAVKVCSVSKKVHTTRKKARAILIEGDTQVVFLDTPGLVTKWQAQRHRLGKEFLEDSDASAKAADVLLVLHDASNHWTRDALDRKALRILHLFPGKESVLVFNKVDLLRSKRKLLDLVRVLSDGVIGGRSVAFRVQRPGKRPDGPGGRTETVQEMLEGLRKRQWSEEEVREHVKTRKGWPGFSSVFMVSALTGDGCRGLKVGGPLLLLVTVARWWHVVVAIWLSPSSDGGI